MKASRIDLSTYKRREHFEFFSQFDEPFYGLTSKLDCTEAYNHSKTNSYSFYTLYTYLIAKAINSVEELRMRIIDGQPVIFDNIHISATVLRKDETFGFSRIIYDEDFQVFKHNMKLEIEKVCNTNGLNITPNMLDVIHYSSIPWIDFSSLSHARHFKGEDSMPKISVGKMTEVNGRKLLPISIHVNHALVDGIHLGKFFEKCQQLFDEPF